MAIANRLTAFHVGILMAEAGFEFKSAVPLQGVYGGCSALLYAGGPDGFELVVVEDTGPEGDVRRVTHGSISIYAGRFEYHIGDAVLSSCAVKEA